MDIKAVLKHVPLEEPEKVFDTGVAAYLLNPLKSSYTYDDIAREYLDGMMLPAKEDLLGKTSLKKAWEEEMDKYLDDAYIAHLKTVRIVHGKGTGALRKGVHNYLKRQKHVASYRLGEFGEGDAGVTIVEFKK